MGMPIFRIVKDLSDAYGNLGGCNAYIGLPLALFPSPGPHILEHPSMECKEEGVFEKPQWAESPCLFLCPREGLGYVFVFDLVEIGARCNKVGFETFKVLFL